MGKLVQSQTRIFCFMKTVAAAEPLEVAPWETRSGSNQKGEREREEEETRRRREEETEVETTTCHDIGRPPKLSLTIKFALVCVCGEVCVGYAPRDCRKTAWVCAGYAPRDCRFKPALGIRWGVCTA